MDELDELVKCPRCREEVLADEICPDHEVCLWCDLDCKLTAAEDDEDE